VTDITVTLTPTELSADVSVTPLTIDVNTPAPVIVDVSGHALAVTLAPTILGVALSQVGQAGPAGPPGSSSSAAVLSIVRHTTYALSGQRAVTANDAGLLIYASCDDLNYVSRPVWLTTGAWDADVDATLLVDGPVTEPGWAFTPGEPIWLGINGVLTQSIPVGALFVRELAQVADPQTIVFQPDSPVVKG
jgi:hypothetical protein